MFQNFTGDANSNNCCKVINNSNAAQAEMLSVEVFYAKVESLSTKIFLGALPPDPLSLC